MRKFTLFGLLIFLTFGCTSVNDAAVDPPLEANAAAASSLVFSQNFNQYSSNGLYTVAKANRDFGPISAKTSGEIRGLSAAWPHKTRVVGGALRAEYLKGIASGRNGGFLFDRTFRDSEEATMEYRVKFDKDLVWRYGGKLPGLGGTAVNSIPAGCTTDPNRINNAFSMRLMWRQSGGSGPARLIVYSYLPDRDTSKCGVDHTIIRGIQKDKWYTVRQYIKLNTPGQRNGVLKMYIDGKLRLEKNNILYRKAGKGNVKINNAIFHTYRGGGANDPRWISPTTDYIYFDDFKVWTGEAGGNGGNGGGNTSFAIRARGKSGGEKINFRINQKTIKTFTLSKSYKTYTTSSSNKGGINVEYFNDAPGRDVQIDYIKVGSQTRQAEAQSYNTGAWGGGKCGGGTRSEMMQCNGVLGFGQVVR